MLTYSLVVDSLGLCTCIVLISALIRTRLKATRTLQYPPGPKPWPVIGNLLQISQNRLYQWLAFTEWGKQYGDVMHLSFFGYHIIVLNSMEAASDLLEKRSGIYSGRPELPMLGDLAGWNEWAFSIMDYTPVWRQARRLFSQNFNHTAVSSHQMVQLAERKKLLLRLLGSPSDFRAHIKLMASAIIIRILYAIEVNSFEDKYIKIAEGAIEAAVESGIPGTFLVDVLPILKYVPSWIPGASFKIKARRWREYAARLRSEPLEAIKLANAAGITGPSVAAKMFRDSDGTAKYENAVANSCASAYAGGSDTTTSSLASLFLAMTLYPEVQRKAQAELDAIVGRGRLPRISDRPSLPYIEAIVKELLRWQPVVPLGLARRVEIDDEYRGYYLPRGAIVFGNLWAILHNDREYENPQTFEPGRFLKDGKLNPDILDPERAVFGFGRRICPGRHLAMDTIFITVASVLAVFDICPTVDDGGVPVPIKAQMSPGLLSYPEEFKCNIKPRFDNARAFLEQTMDVRE